MSLEAVIQENTSTMRELIAVWSKLTAQAKTIDQSDKIENVTAAGTPVQAKPEKAAKVEKVAKVEKAEAKPEAPAEQAPVAVATPVVEAAEGPSFDDVKKAVTELAKASHADAFAVLQSFGVARATHLKPEQYADVLAACKKAMA